MLENPSVKNTKEVDAKDIHERKFRFLCRKKIILLFVKKKDGKAIFNKTVCAS